MGSEQGMLNVAAVPHVAPSTLCAVLATVGEVTAAEMGYCAMSCVPIAFGKFCCAHCTNSGASKEVEPLVLASDRNGSADTKKNVWSLTIGPPIAAPKLSSWKGWYLLVNSVRAHSCCEVK